MKDINNRADIELLVNSFYKKVVDDDLIGSFFTEIVELKWDQHIPLICDFWEPAIPGVSKYKGNPMEKHILLNQSKPLQKHHFERWISRWKTTIDDLFSGEKAEAAKKS